MRRSGGFVDVFGLQARAISSTSSTTTDADEAEDTAALGPAPWPVVVLSSLLDLLVVPSLLACAVLAAALAYVALLPDELSGLVILGALPASASAPSSSPVSTALRDLLMAGGGRFGHGVGITTTTTAPLPPDDSGTSSEGDVTWLFGREEEATSVAEDEETPAESLAELALSLGWASLALGSLLLLHVILRNGFTPGQLLCGLATVRKSGTTSGQQRPPPPKKSVGSRK